MRKRNAITFENVRFRWIRNFPDGTAGLGLLIVRSAVGLAFMIQGRCYFSDTDTGMWLVGVGTLVLGGLLAVGFLTPVAGALGIIGGLLLALSAIPDCSSALSHSNYSLFLAGSILAEILLAGPGAYSIDARLFGRREIIIPRINSFYEP